MADIGWFNLLIAAIGGGLIVKLLDIAYQELRRHIDHSQSAKEFVNENLDPVLKAADELVGKLRSLAKDDFRSIHNVDLSVEHIENHDFSGLLYLLAKLWASIEIFRHKGLSVTITQDERGKHFQSFMSCIESRKVRIVDRISQRAVGELMLTCLNEAYETTSFIKFVKLIESDSEAQRWISPVTRVLSRTLHTSERQRLLQYGAIIHAMIDTLDPDHEVTSDRPSYPHKLSKKSKRNLRYRVFGVYLGFVTDSGKYYESARRRLSGRERGGARKLWSLKTRG